MVTKQITCLAAVLFLSIVPISLSRLLTSSSSNSNSMTMHLVNRKLQEANSRHEYLLNHLESDILKVNALSAARSADAPLFSGLELTPGYAEYVTSMAVGTPPTNISMVLDTWGNALWLQCQTCTNCYNQTTPIFNPADSTSYSTLECGDKRCEALQRSQASNCTTASNPCLYNQTYGRGWYTSGEISAETFTFGDTPVENVSFGCGHDNEGLFDDSDGFLTLSRGPMSFVSQTKGQFGGKFAYCLSSLLVGPASNLSSISFGEAAVPPNAAGTTSLTPNPKYRNYYVDFEGVSLDGERVGGFDESVFRVKEDGDGGVMVDVLTSVMWMATPAHNAVTAAFREALGNTHMTKPPYRGLDTCYDLSDNKTLTVPKMALHFKGFDLDLPVDNYFNQYDENGTYCLSLATYPRNLSFGVLGNIMQQGMRVSYDLLNSKISIIANGCT